MTIAVKRQQDCAICKELRGSQQTRISLALEDENVSNAVLVLSDLFAVIPSVGPLVRGHALVVTRRHSSNILASLDESGYSEFREVCRQYSDWSKNAGASDTRLLCFEHGSRCSTEQMLCSTGHGHVHLLPLQNNESTRVLEALAKQGFKVKDFHELCGVAEHFKQYVTAFSIGPQQQNLQGVVRDGSNVPSQYLRRVIAEVLGLPQWDWKSNIEMNSDLLREMLVLGFQINTNAADSKAEREPQH